MKAAPQIPGFKTASVRPSERLKCKPNIQRPERASHKPRELCSRGKQIAFQACRSVVDSRCDDDQQIGRMQLPAGLSQVISDRVQVDR
jgi:hypothetical protein